MGCCKWNVEITPLWLQATKEAFESARVLMKKLQSKEAHLVAAQVWLVYPEICSFKDVCIKWSLDLQLL
jgi:hypothetical protein